VDDTGGLSFDDEGFLDLSVFPDGDPDTVLGEAELDELHEAIAADHQEVGEVELSLVDGMLDGVSDMDLDRLVPDADATVGAGDVPDLAGGPFDLTEFAEHLDGGVQSGEDLPDDHGGAEGSEGEGGAPPGTEIVDEDEGVLLVDHSHIDTFGIEDDDTDLAAYDDPVDEVFDDFGADTAMMDGSLFDPAADHGWEMADDPIVADSFDGLKDDEWGNG